MCDWTLRQHFDYECAEYLKLFCLKLKTEGCRFYKDNATSFIRSYGFIGEPDYELIQQFNRVLESV